MTEEELRYPSLRVVMQYLEANKSAVLSSSTSTEPSLYPSISSTSGGLVSTSTAQSINLESSVNDGPKILKEYQRVNSSNGSDFDFDQFGRTDMSSNQVITPGDIPVERAHAPIVEREGEEEDAHMEQITRRLAHLKTLRKMKQREAEKKRIEAKLYEWNLRRENKYPPYSMYLKYTIINLDKTKKIEYLEYNKKVYEGLKYLYNFLFAGRKCSLRVKRLEICDLGGVLRLPESLKITARILDTGTNFGAIFDAIQPILEKKSFQEISIYGGLPRAASLNHAVINKTEMLSIFKVKLTGDMFQAVLNNQNKKFHSTKGKLTNEEYIELVEKMITDKRSVGTCYSFGVDKRLLKSLYKELKTWEGVTKRKWLNKKKSRFPVTYYLRIDDSPSFLAIHCSRNTNYDEKIRDQEPYTLWLQVRSDVKKPSMKPKKAEMKKFTEMMAKEPFFGTRYSIEIQSRTMVREMFNGIKAKVAAKETVTVKKEERRGCARFPFTYSWPIGNTARWTVYCDRSSNLNKKGSNVKPWTLRISVEQVVETTPESYVKVLSKLVTDKDMIGTRYPIEVQTKEQVKKLLSEVKSRDGVTMTKQNRGSSKFPYTYTIPMTGPSKLVVFCDRKKDYNEKDPKDKPWVIWHCVEKVVKKCVT